LRNPLAGKPGETLMDAQKGRGRRKGAALLCVLLGLLFLLQSCPFDKSAADGDDLSLAEAALNERDISDAAMYFERYLRKNPTGIKRWEVWWQLLSIALDIRRDKRTASEYLEIMLAEFSDDPSRRRRIQMLLARMYSDLLNDASAVRLWEALTADPDTPPPDRAAVYRELSRVYLRRLEFSRATEMLGLCLDLDVSSEIKADCLYTLAETQMFTGDLADSEQALRELLRLEDISNERRVLVVFMLADVLEQQDRLPEATELFESIRETYPNTRVTEIRLGALKTKSGDKRPAAKAKKSGSADVFSWGGA
jgi:tetratricopeptide (TPR) repeat protein